MKTEDLRELILEKEADLGELKRELEHQERTMPAACQCDPDDWRDGKVNGICTEYEENDETGLCKNCEHPDECH